MLKKLSALLLVLVLLAVTFAAAETAEPIVEKKTIAPFIDLTWEEVALYGENARNMTAAKRNAGYWEYHVNFHQLDSGVIAGTINAETESYLQYVWRNLGQECIGHFTSYKQLATSNIDELAVYVFQDDQTYLRFGYMNSRYEDYILFVIIHSEE